MWVGGILSGVSLTGCPYMGGSGLQGRGQEEKEGSGEAFAVVRVSGGDHCE